MSDSHIFLEAGTTSVSLLALAAANDEAGWRRLTELYGPLIYSWCRQARLQPEDSADIVQEVFRSVLLNISNFEKTETTGSFRGWLFTITRNKVRDHHKVRVGKAQATGGSLGQRLLLEHVNDPLSSMSDLTDLADPATAGLAYRVLNIIKTEVKESTWNAFWRSTIDGIHPAVVAEELQISIPSVWQARSRVLRRARQLLES